MIRRIVSKFKAAESFLARAGVLRADLPFILQKADPSAPLGDKIEWIEELIGWVRIPVTLNTEGQSKQQQIQSTRIRFLFMHLDRNPPLKAKVSQAVGAILAETESLPLFSQLGLSREHGFFAEAVNRLAKKILPTPSNETDLAELFVKIFRDEQDADWIENLDDSTTAKLNELLFSDSQAQHRAKEGFTASIKNALIVLSAQIAAMGLSPEIRSRARVKQVHDSAFFELSRQISYIGEANWQQSAEYLIILERCRQEIRTALSHLDTFGVSVVMVYRLEFLEQAIDRCEKLTKVIVSEGEHSQIWKVIIADLIRERFKSTEITSLFRDNLDLLARKIVERAGVSGEHYIARNKQEYVSMMKSASGGGILTVFTTVLKGWILAAGFPLFIEGFFAWVNYAGSFLLMQGLGFTLATKQPAMTAPALAMKLRNLKRRTQLWEFVQEITQLTRSQVAAAIGNIGLVIPGAIVFDIFWKLSFGEHVVPLAYAHKTIESFNPFTTLTVPMAALTGVMLWLSSIAAGWLENWTVYRRIPEAIAQNRTIKRVFGPVAGGRASEWFARNISGIGGNVSLGFFLAFTPVFGRFFGLPLNVPHVTLSSGALTFAVCSIGFKDIDIRQLVLAALCIMMIGLLNFGVSFALALYTALRARHIRKTWLLSLGTLLWGKFRYHPLDFLIPKKEA